MYLGTRQTSQCLDASTVLAHSLAPLCVALVKRTLHVYRLDTSQDNIKGYTVGNWVGTGDPYNMKKSWPYKANKLETRQHVSTYAMSSLVREDRVERASQQV